MLRRSRVCGALAALVVLLGTMAHAQSEPVPEASNSQPGEPKTEPQQLFERASAMRTGVGTKKPEPAAALDAMRTAADMGHPAALAGLGEMLMLGEVDGLPSSSEAVPFLQQGSDLGDSDAQLLLGMLYSRGEGGKEQDEAAAVLHTHFSALASNTRAELTLGYRHLYGLGVPQNCHDSVAYYTRVADKAVQFAQNGQAPFIEKKRLSEGTQPDGNSLGENEDLLMYYEQAADGGDASAQSTLGQLFYYGARGVQRDYVQAKKYFELAAAQGDGASMSSLGHMYAQGLGMVQDNTTALYWFRKGADLGNPASKNGLGYMHMYGVGLSQNYATALTYFTQAAEAGNPEAQFNMGAMQIGGLGLKRDHSKAVQFFTLAAQQGHMVALYNLGLMHLNGLGTPRSCPVAVQILKGVAERGPWASVMANATSQLSHGRVSQALALYELAAETGFEIAQSNAAHILDEMGDQLPEMPTEPRMLRAAKWYRKAAQQANVHAELRLGDFFYYGLTGEQDYSKAAAHYRTAAEQKNPQAMFNMGFLHQVGHGLPQDLHLAKRYFDMAAETQSKAYVPATLALWLLPVYGFYVESVAPALEQMELDEDHVVIVAVSTLLTIVLCSICVRRLLQ